MFTEDDEQLYEIDETLTSMTVDGLLFWLPKFVAEVRKSGGGLYPPNSVYQICCGFSHALKSNRIDILVERTPDLKTLKCLFLTHFFIVYCAFYFFLDHLCCSNERFSNKKLTTPS